MRTYPSKRGPLPEQIFYEVEEIENICRDELQGQGLYPSEPSPIRIDRFIEKRFKILPSYEDLPPGVLGFTRFGLNGVEEIVVAKALDEEGSKPAERRLRTTLAHEGGHGLLHAHLFVLGAKPASLFGDAITSDASKILCREDGVPAGATNESKYQGSLVGVSSKPSDECPPAAEGACAGGSGIRTFRGGHSRNAFVTA